MGCCGDREKALIPTDEQKWEYLTLSDFKSHSCLTPLSYVWLWILVIISIAVYAADAFTAVNLLAYNTWTGEVQPKVPFDVAKWIFAVCIILSYVFLAYRWFRAWRVIRSGSVTESYLEPLAAIFNSLRLTSEGKGWRRFLVYAQLTKSRKGVDYLALFVYFQFKGALLIIVAQGPRMAINALTLWAVMQAQIIPVGEHAPENRSGFEQFFKNIETMINKGDKRETVIYFTMLFSLVIWVIAALSLILSVILYLLFLWHYVPNSDGTLTQYCRRKMEARLDRIVNKTARKAAEREEAKRKKQEEKAMKKAGLPRPGFKDDDTSSVISTTTTTLPPYPARTNTSSTTATSRTVLTKNSLASFDRRPIPSRSDTGLTYASDAPLLKEAGGMGSAEPTPPMPPLDQKGDYFRDGPGSRPPPVLSVRSPPPMYQQRDPLPPLDTYSADRVSPSPQLISPLPSDPRGQRDPPYPLQEAQFGGPTFSPYDNRGPMMGPSYEMSPVDISPLADVLQHYDHPSSSGSDSSGIAEVPSALRAGPSAPPQGMNSSFASLPPSRAGTAPPNHPRAGIPAALQSAIQRREAAQPQANRGPNGMIPQQRSATAPLQQPGWGHGPAPRSNTTTPGAAGYRRDASQPLPYRGPNSAMHQQQQQQQYGVNAQQQAGWSQAPYPRTNTAAPAQGGYRHDASQPLPNRPNVRIQQQRSATMPLEEPAWEQNQDPYPRSNTAGPYAGPYAGPNTGGYNGLDFSQH